MTELVQFFIETASQSGEHLAGMLFAGVVVLSILCVTAYQILDLLVSWFKRIKPIQIKKVEKIEKVIEVPKYTENQFNKEIKEHLEKLKKVIDTMAEDIKSGSVKL